MPRYWLISDRDKGGTGRRPRGHPREVRSLGCSSASANALNYESPLCNVRLSLLSPLDWLKKTIRAGLASSRPRYAAAWASLVLTD